MEPRQRTDELVSRALQHLDENELVSLLQRMVQFRSYSAGGEEGDIAKYVAAYTSEMGLEAELDEVEPNRFNVISSLRGTGGGKSLMFNGHLDTNPAGSGWTRDPFAGEVDEGFIYGIGVSNMKAADAAYIAAVRAVQRAGIELRGDIILAHVVGELQGGVGSAHLVRQGIRADRFIVGEPTDLAVLTLHAGSIELQVTTYGKTRHLSKMEEAVDAIEKMLPVMARLKSMEFSGPPDEAGVRRVAIGTIRGGLGPDHQDWRPALIADTCTIKLSVRFGPDQNLDTVLEDIRRELAALQSTDPDLEIEVKPNVSGQRLLMGPFSVAEDADIVQNVIEGHKKVTGKLPRVGAVAPYKFYGTDAYHLAQAGMTGVVYGPGGKYNTMPDERVELDDLFAAARVYIHAIIATCA